MMVMWLVVVVRIDSPCKAFASRMQPKTPTHQCCSYCNYCMYNTRYLPHTVRSTVQSITVGRCHLLPLELSLDATSLFQAYVQAYRIRMSPRKTLHSYPPVCTVLSGRKGGNAHMYILYILIWTVTMLRRV